jgi:hypothetical protein
MTGSTPEQRSVEVSRRISEGMLRAQATGIYDLALYARSDEPANRVRHETAKLAADQFDQAASAYINAGTGLEAMQRAWQRFLQASRYGSP